MLRSAVPALAATAILVAVTAFTPTAASALPNNTIRQVTGASPYAANCHEPSPGATYVGSELEPSLAVDPRDRGRIAISFQQDRRSNGGAEGIGIATSADGGRSWHTAAAPPFSQCAGGTAGNGGDFERASNAWLSFGPDGTLYLVALATSPLDGPTAILASTSHDAGRTWGPVRPLIDDNDPNVLNDKPAVTADPYRRGYAYAVWDRLSLGPQATDPSYGPTYFARTTDGGRTWQTARPIIDPGANAQTIGSQIVVLGDGTLVLITDQITPDGVGHMSSLRSTDGGATWEKSAHEIAASQWARVTDPITGAPVRTADYLPSAASDPRPGSHTLYATWQDSQLTGGVTPQVLLSRSSDGGRTWSAPTRLSQPDGSGFLPQLAVDRLGIPMLTYLDFSRDDPATPALETTMWSRFGIFGGRWSAPRATRGVTIDMTQAPVAGGYFLGDYTGLASTGFGFVAAVAVPHLVGQDPADIVYTRIW